jgi:cell fate (sporulation/competence/biofilm development) regulator YlbF (YheA/YmcA/DUF963 family)
MSAIAQDPAVALKTRELCQAILDAPAVKTLRSHIDAFLADDLARAQYEKVANQGETLQNKQRQAQPISDDEISAFESDRQTLLNNPVASAFLRAQEEMHHLQHSLQNVLGKTLELGRVPTQDDVEGSCGHGCGCQH